MNRYEKYTVSIFSSTSTCKCTEDNRHTPFLPQMMESKLLVGGKSIIDKTTEQERALEEQRRLIAEQQV